MGEFEADQTLVIKRGKLFVHAGLKITRVTVAYLSSLRLHLVSSWFPHGAQQIFAPDVHSLQVIIVVHGRKMMDELLASIEFVDAPVQRALLRLFAHSQALEVAVSVEVVVGCLVPVDMVVV